METKDNWQFLKLNYGYNCLVIKIRTMYKILFSTIILCLSLNQIYAQGWAKKGKAFQVKLDQQYKDAKTSPLPKDDVAGFTGHPFFEMNKKFIVKAQLERTPEAKPFQMPTSTDRLPIYKKYGVAVFTIDGNEHRLSIYQNQKFKSSLFLPFYDLTSGDSTYGGGRYLDIKIPKGKKIKIDFNQAYHPYCAYSDAYSCPIPPIENRLDIEINAGVKLADKYNH